MNESYTKTVERNNKLIKKNDIISALIFLSLLGIPAEIQAKIQTSKDNIKNTIEQNDTTNLLDKMNQKFWITLPSQYNENLKNFISNSATLRNEAAAKFTENFISEQMSQNRWISKENQYLFIRCAIYYTLTNWELYDWTDWNEQRYNEYEIAFEYFLNCEENYKTNLRIIMENELKNADERLQKSENDIMASDTLLLNEMVRFYNLNKNNSNILTAWEIQEIKRIAKETIESCNRHWIDYRAYFLERLWDSRKVEELFKICEIE